MRNAGANTGKLRNPFSWLILLLIFAFPLSRVYGEIYTPPGYVQGQTLGGSGYGIDFGVMKLAEDYYLSLTPSARFHLWKISVGLEVPLQVLVYDKDPKGTAKVPSLRSGTYNDIGDLAKLITYVSYGNHLYYDPDALFSWSVYVGKMNDGYIGHRTIVNRYVTSYDPTYYRAGLMADINNRWGGVEVFRSDLFRNEVSGGRVYIRPTHIVASVHNLFVAGNGFESSDVHRVAAKEPNVRFYQERLPRSGEGGRLGQQTFLPLEEEKKNYRDDFHLEEIEDPASGDVQVRAVKNPERSKSEDRPAASTGAGNQLPSKKDSLDHSQDQQQSSAGTNAAEVNPRESRPASTGAKDSDTTPAVVPLDQKKNEKTPQTTSEGSEEVKPLNEKKEEKSTRQPMVPWKSGFWDRWAIGYSMVKDVNAPLTLEHDGSGNLVFDPGTGLPRSLNTDSIAIAGVDTELRLSPFDWLDFTPYVDFNKVRNLDKSHGLHIGIDTQLRLTDTLRLTIRPEYRELTANYIPTYFDSYYVIERTGYNASASNQEGETKLNHLRSLPTSGALTKGGIFYAMLDWTGWVVLEFSYEDYAGINNSRVFAGLYVPSIFGFFLNGYYEKKYFDSYKEAFQVDDRSLLAGEVGYSLFGGFYVKATLRRTWEKDSSASTYVSKDEIVYGFGFNSAL